MLVPPKTERIGIAGAGKMVPPLEKPKIVKKYTKKFKRHQHDRKIAVKVRRPACLHGR